MNTNNCALCEIKKNIEGVIFLGDNLFVTKCKTCDSYMAISIDHKPAFDSKDRLNIYKAFFITLKLTGRLDWKMNEYKDHANVHLRK